VFGGQPPTFADFIRQSVGGALSSRGSVYRWAEARDLLAEHARSIRFRDGVVCPNPLYLANADSPAGRHRLDVLTGRSHGDLHLGNVLIPDIGGLQPTVDRFQLVDLDTYQPHGPLTTDPVFFLLSGVAHCLTNVPAHRWDAVRSAVLRPTQAGSSDPPFDLVSSVSAATTRTIRDLDDGLTGDWTIQFLLSTLAGALTFTAFCNLGPRRRAWFFRLAAECGRVLLYMLNEAVPDDAVSVDDLFPGPLAAVSQPDVREARLLPAADVDRLITQIWTLPANSEETDRLFRQAYSEIRHSLDARSVVAVLCQLHQDASRLLGPRANLPVPPAQPGLLDVPGPGLLRSRGAGHGVD